MDRWMDIWMGRWMDILYEWIYGWIDRWMDIWMDVVGVTFKKMSEPMSNQQPAGELQCCRMPAAEGGHPITDNTQCSNL